MLKGKRQAGLSLVEIMVALVIGLLLSAALFNIFISSKKTYRVSEASARLQENGRFALEMLTFDLRMVGHQGCADPAVVAANVADGLGFAYPGNALEGGDGGAAADTITVRYGGQSFGRLTSAMSDVSSAISVDWLPGDAAAGDVFVISDCDSADVFKASAVSGKTVTPPSLSKAYSHDRDPDDDADTASRLMRLEAATYEVKDTTRTSVSGEPIYALYRNGEEVLEGVETLQITYGVAEGNNVRYRDWQAGLELDSIVSVRIGLLLHSAEEVLDEDDDAEYSLAGVTVKTSGAGPVHAVDRRLRRVFETTVQLRNR